MIVLKTSRVLALVIFLLAGFIISCNKDSVPIDSDDVTTSLAVSLKDGRLVFSDFDQYHSTLKAINNYEMSVIPNGFKSYYDLTSSKLESMSEEELVDYIQSGDYRKYFMIETDFDNEKHIVPIMNSFTYGNILNKDLEYQIGNKIYKLDEFNLYIIPLEEYSSYGNPSNSAEETYPIVRKSDSFGRDIDLDDCTTFFLKKSGNWTRKLQGKIIYTGTGSGNGANDFREWRVESRSRKKTSLGYWVGTNEYPVQLSGSVVIRVKYLDGSYGSNETFPFSQSCGSCELLAVDYNIYDVTLSQPIANVDFISLVSAAGTHKIQCNGDCANEGVGGWVTCNTSE